jgi:archaetidylinositol phosphate synthase
MLETRVRHKVQPLFNGIAILLQSCYATPLRITGCAFLFGIAAAVMLAMDYTTTAIALLWLSGLCDILDGTLARLLESEEPWGAYNDLISDKLVESALIIAFYIWQPQFAFVYLIYMVAMLFHSSTFVAANALIKGRGKKSAHYDNSIIERAESFIVFTGMMLLPEYIGIMLMGLSCVLVMAGVMRYFRVLKHVNK